MINFGGKSSYSDPAGRHIIQPLIASGNASITGIFVYISLLQSIVLDDQIIQNLSVHTLSGNNTLRIIFNPSYHNGLATFNVVNSPTSHKVCCCVTDSSIYLSFCIEISIWTYYLPAIAEDSLGTVMLSNLEQPHYERM